MSLKFVNPLFFESKSTNKTNNRSLDSAHKSIYGVVVDVKNIYVDKNLSTYRVHP